MKTTSVFRPDWSLVERMFPPPPERRLSDRRAQGGDRKSAPEQRERRVGIARRLASMVVWTVPALFVTLANATDRVQFEATRAAVAGQVQLRAEVSKPEGDGPFPAVVLMHGCGGWQPAVRYSLGAYADYLVRHGFVVLNLDSFGPRNLAGGKVCENVDQQAQALTYRTFDAFDALHYLQRQKYVSADNIFLMGQSNGGSVAINVAKGDVATSAADKTPGFRAVVAFYPWCGSFARSKVKLEAPLMVLAGGRDDWVPARECEGVQSSGAELSLKVYPQAAHSFDLDIVPQRYLGKLIGKDSYAAEDSRERMLSFFERHTTGSAERSTTLATGQKTTNQP